MDKNLTVNPVKDIFAIPLLLDYLEDVWDFEKKKYSLELEF
jgi:hypothetical protein